MVNILENDLPTKDEVSISVVIHLHFADAGCPDGCEKCVDLNQDKQTECIECHQYYYVTESQTCARKSQFLMLEMAITFANNFLESNTIPYYYFIGVIRIRYVIKALLPQ